MKHLLIILFLFYSFLSFAQKAVNKELISTICSNNEGYYKDIFMDGGIKLTSLKRLPAAELLSLKLENLMTMRYSSTFPATLQDSIIQSNLIIGSEEDLNGVLLYPDGEPRFRMIYVNGGKSAGHGKSLGEIGRDRIRTFVQNGGSYVGSCAGAFFSSSGTISADTIKKNKYYSGVWPGLTKGTGLIKNYTGIFIEKKSPLLRYFDFGNDRHVDSVRHNGGCFAYTEKEFPAETEVLARYNYENPDATRKIHNEINTWAYKKDKNTGRVVVTGSHPEAVPRGERLEFMSSMMLYALEGVAPAKIKAELRNGKKRNMFKSTLDNNPEHTMIGDKQYHHFIVDIPPKATNISIKLECANDYELFLFINKDDFAFKGNSTYSDISLESTKEFKFDSLKPGTWYISVLCNTSVETIKTSWGYKYVGRTDVLNGVPYSITAKWEDNDKKNRILKNDVDRTGEK